jgi:hypothetical protein
MDSSDCIYTMKSYWNHLLLSLSYLILIERKAASALLLRSHDQSLTPTFLQSKIDHQLDDDVDVDKPSTPPGHDVSQPRRRTTMKMALLIAAATTLPPNPPRPLAPNPERMGMPSKRRTKNGNPS